MPGGRCVGALVLAALLLLAACGSSLPGRGRVAAACPAVFFGVAGSGQGPHNPPPSVLPKGVSAADGARYGGTVALLKVRLARLGGRHLASAAAIDYPALPVDRYLGPAGLTSALETSESSGISALLRAIGTSTAGRCSRRPVLLAGYSQGAEVVIRAVGRLRPAQRRDVAVALFGNPSYQPGVTGDYPGHTRAAGLRPTFERTAFALPGDVRARTIDVCAPGDPVCGVDPDVPTVFGKIGWVLQHTAVHADAYAFGTAGYADIAARFLWRHRLR